MCLGIDQTRLADPVNLLANASTPASGQADRQPGWKAGARRSATSSACATTALGIPPAARVHLFEPFFTTKPGEYGLGLGLTLRPARLPPPAAASA